MPELSPRFLSREHWTQLASVGVMIAVAGLGAAAWIINTVNSGTAAALAAINTQSAIFSKQASDLDHRVTTLEAEFLTSSRTQDRLITTNDQIRGALSELTTSVQRLNDLLPERPPERLRR